MSWAEDNSIDIGVPDYMLDVGDSDVWVTKDKETIKIRHLKTNHLINIISYINRGNNVFGQHWKLKYMEEEMSKRHEN